ncbi:hypothetical protein P872_12220 [Rhodonellum psychrophilum GCM71 = DSM 17998]|uniref:Uncharacterized protein n=1 Tax=Rhodonellum psychrophilum GCM71 = DSM 17998 TaxID=1123057 RepID=U5BSI4_9BACT|nr:hypothetical protein P872_12220 [Rhodonellum psychrophilum GCM71 = DSM 17998]
MRVLVDYAKYQLPKEEIFLVVPGQLLDYTIQHLKFYNIVFLSALLNFAKDWEK